MGYKNKEDLYKKQKEHREKNRAKAVEYLENHPCVDCGETNPVVLDFDHVKGQKSFNIGRAISGSHRSWQKIMDEISKCEIRCANCHRKKTAIQFGWYKS
jgi:hypothetical protein